MTEDKAAARERARRWYAENRERGRRARRAYYIKNREKIREQARAYRAANLEADRARQRQYERDHPEDARRRSNRWKAANKDAVSASGRRYRASLKATVLDHYGRVCACCGATGRLTIDHVNGDGKQHREQVFGRQQAGPHFYRWLISNGFPEGFQVLCLSCNNSKKNRPQCTLNHQERA
jgi:hypothetical protein